MARKTKEDTQATREGILDAAEACFHEHGVARTTLEMIGARAGYTRGAVYWHFKNKAEVLEAMINRVSLPFFHGLDRVSRPDGRTPLLDLRETMRQAFADLVHTPRVRATLEVLELRCEIPASDDTLATLRKTGMHQTLSRIKAAFRRAEALGQLREDMSADSCARTLHFIIGGALLPQVAARIADAAGALQPAFIVPLLGYVGLTVFAIAAARTKVRDPDVVKAPSPH